MELLKTLYKRVEFVVLGVAIFLVGIFAWGQRRKGVEEYKKEQEKDIEKRKDASKKSGDSVGSIDHERVRDGMRKEGWFRD